MRTWILFFALLWMAALPAQEPSEYKMPPKELAELIDAPPTPSVSLSPDRSLLLILERQGLPSIEELGREELRLAGLRIDPRTNGPSRSRPYVGLALQRVEGGVSKPVQDLPAQPRITDVSWSPDGRHIAFLHTRDDGIELWVVEVGTNTARRLRELPVNDALGRAYAWFPDGRALLLKHLPADRGAPPAKPAVPAGPVIQSNEGVAAPVRTYQDLLKNPYDESLFEYYTHAELSVVSLDGSNRPFGVRGIIFDMDISPDGRYVLVETLRRPFSYIVPWYRFAYAARVYDRSGKPVRTIAELPVAESLPKGFNAVRLGPRSIGWRADAPATLHWVEAQDGGDPNREAAVRDRLFLLDAPFEGEARPVLDFSLRYAGITWGNDQTAIAYERWWRNRRSITRAWSPGNPEAAPKVLFDRSYEDRYNDPGDFETVANASGRQVLLMQNEGQVLFLTGRGASPEGGRPFVDQYHLPTGKTTRLWRSEAPYYEYAVAILDPENGTALTRREANYEPPNYFVRNLRTGALTQITHFPNPYESLEGVTKEFIQFKRSDGVDLTGTLYLPASYDQERDGPLPVFMWAYPREYKDAAAASQVSGSPHTFIRVSPSSPILWVVRGYAVFHNVSMPVIGEGDEEPNETFVEQLRMNAEAAVRVLAERGVGDPERIAIGGHSYGAFMTANLLAHTDLFAAGIARSGAYNRTLTPFGFQSEERTWWEAPETYYRMSPFNFADKIKEPLLLIHGMADNNSGTYPMQSERMFAALKGHGATVRLVMLPFESHGYRTRESLMHLAWETDQWLEKYVRNRPVREGE